MAHTTNEAKRKEEVPGTTEAEPVDRRFETSHE